jgi:hypothetical protein
VIIYNGKIILIRPKMWMANDGNYASPFSLSVMAQLTPAEGIEAFHSVDEIQGD